MKTALFGTTHVESSNKEGQSQKIQVGVHKDPFNLVSILFCETYKTTRSKGFTSRFVRDFTESLTHQTAAENKQRPACGSRTEVSPERWSRRRWSEAARRRCCWSPTIKHRNVRIISSSEVSVHVVLSTLLLKCQLCSNDVQRKEECSKRNGAFDLIASAGTS